MECNYKGNMGGISHWRLGNEGRIPTDPVYTVDLLIYKSMVIATTN